MIVLQTLFKIYGILVLINNFYEIYVFMLLIVYEV